jgi:K(+)-stimulated pyrophosphate-energized sodium pump
MQEIAAAIQEGASAYLNRQYSAIGLVGIVIAVILYFLLGWKVAVGYLIGAILSGATGYIGMHISVRANVRTTEAARSSLAEGLSVSFKAGTVTGMLVAGLALLSVSVYYAFLLNEGATGRDIVDPLVALGFGASLISIFARLGGGIFTKGADVGADLVGKVEAGIPEDDPRNPAVIADNVGDNVGDCAGMAADLFETYVVSVVATMVLASIFFSSDVAPAVMMYPLMIGAVCIVTSIAATFFVRLGSSQNIMAALYKGFVASAVLSAIALWPVTEYVLGMNTEFAVGDTKFLGLWRDRLGPDRFAHLGDRILHRHRIPPGAVGRAGLHDRPRHQRHPGPRHFDGSHGDPGDPDLRRDHRNLPAGGSLWDCDRGHRDAGACRYRCRVGRLRSGNG